MGGAEGALARAWQPCSTEATLRSRLSTIYRLPCPWARCKPVTPTGL